MESDERVDERQLRITSAKVISGSLITCTRVDSKWRNEFANEKTCTADQDTGLDDS